MPTRAWAWHPTLRYRDYFAFLVFSLFVSVSPFLDCFRRCANFVAGIRTTLPVFRPLLLFPAIDHQQTDPYSMNRLTSTASSTL